ncbi:ArsA family ATPase [Fluviispira vulneris]|uniref:ArsA family ATPase n=1 Tax=Fluviispira vulneris TaxID=2763012 RepID=UPI0016471C72|nr:ArsA-related P-loop ATPase [Fluviispira vulneris]
MSTKTHQSHKMQFSNQISQKLLFVVGKGGVGRTTVATSLATYFAGQGESVLVVQWALKDSISPLYSSPQCSHKETALPSGFKVMNYSAAEAIKEYFVDHLKMKLLYSVIIENKHVQKLIHAAPGVQELFFLGRLFWLVELAQCEKGYSYDRVIVDAPATGHAVSLFGIAPAIANFGITGPLANECERVAKLIADPQKTGVIVVTLPEELPVEECYETIPKITKQLNRSPNAIFLNQSINPHFFKGFENIKNEDWFIKMEERFKHDNSKEELELILASLAKRDIFEKKLSFWAQNNHPPIPIISLPDIGMMYKSTTSLTIINSLAKYYATLA